MFFLHKDASIEEEEAAEKEARRQQRHERRQAYGEAILNGELPGEEVSDDSEDEEEEQEGPPLMYVLSLVNTKQDNTVKRYRPPSLLYSRALTVTGVPSSKQWQYAPGTHFSISTKCVRATLRPILWTNMG